MGESAFEIASPGGPVPVAVYRPRAWSASNPVWVVMHGLKRDAAQAIAQWKPAADRRGALLVVATFTREAWPGSAGYPIGNVVDRQGKPIARDAWAFSALDRAVAEAARRAGSTRTRFSMYGHGAGGQFVQRYVLFTGGYRIEDAVAAAAGWYLVPDAAYDFPYGLRGVELPESTLRAGLAAPLVVMIGADDVKTTGVLRNNAQTLKQGATRVDRAHFIVAGAQRRAARLGVGSGWRLVEVAGVGHRPDAMLPAAEREIDTGARRAETASQEEKR